MLIKRLRLKNFIIFGDVDLDLKDIRLTTVVGSWMTDPRRSNGSGKSALLEGIPYALFGTTRSKQKMDVVRHGSKRCDVLIEFVSNGRDIRIERQRNKDGTSNAKMWVDGEQAASQVRNVDTMVKQYLGVNQDLFELIYFFRQDNQFGFVNASPSERKGHLARVFDLGPVEQCLAVAKVRHKDAQEAQQRAEGAVEALHGTLGALPPKVAMVDRVLDLYNELSHHQLVRHSRQTYLQGIPVDIIEGQNLRDDYDSDIADAVDKLKALESEFTNNNQLIARLNTEIAANESDLLRQRNAIKEMAPDVDMDKSAAQWEQELNDIEDQERDIVARVARLDFAISADKHKAHEVKELAGTECPSCHQMVGVDHFEELVVKCAQSVEKNVALRSQIGMKMAMVRQQMANARDGMALRQHADAQMQQMDQMQQSIDAMARNVRDQLRRAEELSDRQTEIMQTRALLSNNINADQAIAVRHQIDTVLAAHDKLYSDCSFDEQAMSAAAAKAEERLAQYDEISARIAQAVEHVEATKRKVSVLEPVCSAFGRNGLQAILIENVVTVIEQFTNDILKQMQTRFEIRLRTQKTIQTGDQRETLDVVVMHNGEERMFETYSGGERTLINLSLRLSLSRIISSLQGVVMQSLFLDEVLAALDEVNREEAIKVVAFLSKSFEQVFVISHTNEIKDIIPGQITIQRHEDYSEVIVNDGRREEAHTA